MKSLVDNCYRWKSVASVAFPAMRPNETTPHSPLYHPFVSPSFRISRFRPAEHNDESTYKVFFKHDLTNNFSYIYVEQLFLSLNKSELNSLISLHFNHSPATTTPLSMPISDTQSFSNTRGRA